MTEDRGAQTKTECNVKQNCTPARLVNVIVLVITMKVHAVALAFIVDKQ